jgi:ankyrin repeat protein
MSFDLLTSCEYIFQWSETTPWHGFMLFVGAHKDNSSLTLPLPWQNTSFERPIQDSEPNKNGYSHDVVGDIPRYEPSKAQDWLLELFEVDIIVDGFSWRYIDPQCLNPNQYLPKSINEDHYVDMNAVVNLSHQNNQLEFLKLAVKLLSDNACVPGLTSAIVELARDDRVLSVFRRLLDQKLLSVEAFAEKLLVPAIEAGDKKLVEMFIDSGVKVDTEGGVFSALCCAIEYDQTELVKILLNRGASATSKPVYSPWTRCAKCGSLLDVAVSSGNIDIVTAMLTPNNFMYFIPPITLHTLTHAVSLSTPVILLQLLSADPTSVELMKLNPYVVMNSAARGGSTEVFAELMNHGLDINITMHIEGTSNLGRITALAEASYQGHEQLVKYLLSAGAHVDGWTCNLHTPPPLITALWYCKRTPLDWRFPSDWRRYFYANQRFVDDDLGDTRNIVRLLLDHGANPTAFWEGYHAIHFAAFRPNWDGTMVTMLYEAGADISGDENGEHRQAIAFALEAGNPDIVKVLLRIGATLEQNPREALRSVFLGGKRELIDLVLENMPCGSGDSESLQACISVAGCELARDLLDNGIFDATKDYTDERVICAAVYEGDEEFVRRCCRTQGLSQNYKASALAMAAQQHNVGMIQLLLEGGAKPYTPLIYDVGRLPLSSCQSKRIRLWSGTDAMNELFRVYRKVGPGIPELLDMVLFTQATKVLIDTCSVEFGDIEEEEARRSSLRRFTCEAVQHAPLEVIRMLVDSGFRIDENFFPLQSPLQWALRAGNLPVAEFLLDHGSTTNCPATLVEPHELPGSLHTALQCAVQHNLTLMTKALLDKHVDVNAEPARFHGATALQFSAINGNFEIAFMLLTAGANINASPALFDGRTAIEGAAEHGRLNMVKFLLNAGADIRGRHNKNYARTAYRAWVNNHRTVLKMIQEFKRDRFGSDDVVSIEVIVRSMTQDDLDFSDLGEESAWPEIFAQGRRDRQIGSLGDYELVKKWVD